MAAGNINDICSHCRCCSSPPRARALVHSIPTNVCLNNDGIGYAINMGEWGILRYHARLHPLFDSMLGLLCDGQEFNSVSQFHRVLDIDRAYKPDALHGN